MYFVTVLIVYAFFWVIPRRLNLYAIVSEHSVPSGFENVGVYKYRNIRKPSHSLYLPAYEDGTDRVFRNVGI